MDILPDLLEDNLNIVFCGTAVGNKSAEKKAYYAGTGNSFYKTLCEIGLTKEQIVPANYKDLLEYKIGLTDIVKKVSGNDDELKPENYDKVGFISKIEKYNPKIICFNGKKAASVYLGIPTKKIENGIQNCKIGNTIIYVACSTSGSARRYWNIEEWKELNNILRK